ncbi:effector binding domain-containing protein [Erysipelothrix aquatica]|uniref:effector binding domain-containing protein n=1 Tax=Erysipelothrix aquatica TaxID=2683714 RepID=UPI003AF322E5
MKKMNLYLLESFRTNNFTDETMLNKIQGAWVNISKLEPALEGDIYAIYTDYHSDYRGDYGFALATQEPRTEMMIPITPNIDYRVFDVTDRDVAGTWKHIWELEDNGMLNRAYTIDYERYGVDGSIKIYIAIQ